MKKLFPCWGLQGYIIFFLFLLKNIDCEYSLDSEAVLMSTYNLCFKQKYEKYQNHYLKPFRF